MTRFISSLLARLMSSPVFMSALEVAVRRALVPSSAHVPADEKCGVRISAEIVRRNLVVWRTGDPLPDSAPPAHDAGIDGCNTDLGVRIEKAVREILRREQQPGGLLSR